jgi:hypothetical protein
MLFNPPIIYPYMTLRCCYFFQDSNIRMIHIIVPVCSTRRAKNGRLVLLICTGGFCLAPLRGYQKIRRPPIQVVQSCISLNIFNTCDILWFGTTRWWMRLERGCVAATEVCVVVVSPSFVRPRHGPLDMYVCMLAHHASFTVS